MKYTSALLFHGPGARNEAEKSLPGIGRLLAEPVGLNGMKIDDARKVILLLQSSPVGDEPCACLIGPVDRAEQAATDVLLKAIEEFDPETVRPVLWAEDLGSVSSTIKSRCIHRWCPGSGSDSEPEEAMALAFELVNSASQSDRARVIELLKEGKDKDLSFQNILDACVRVLSFNPEELIGPKAQLWYGLRRLLGYRHVGIHEVHAVFLEVER